MRKDGMDRLLLTESPDHASAVAALKSATSVLALTHVQPDGDGLGSQAALVLGLRKMGKMAWAAPQEVPATLRFLGLEALALPKEAPTRFDLAVTLDCPVKHRLGPGAEWLEKADQVLVVDHHADSQPFGTLKLFDPWASSTGEMVAGLLRKLGVAPSPEMATALFTALVTDTGSFRYSNTHPGTFRLAESLTRAGAKPWEVSRQLYESQTLSSLRLLGKALELLKLEAGGRLALLSLPWKVLKDCGAKEEDCEGLVERARAIQGVEASAFLRETSDGSIKLSLRSKGGLDVQAIAARFHGGGHKAAAGATLQASTLEAAEKEVLKAMMESLA
jgi:phosphoesterase RecJ-like protein